MSTCTQIHKYIAHFFFWFICQFLSAKRKTVDLIHFNERCVYTNFMKFEVCFVVDQAKKKPSMIYDDCQR
jgi:hypothetical protein